MQKQGKTIHHKTFEFNNAESGQIIDQKFTFKPVYDEYHTYKIRLLADKDFFQISQKIWKLVGLVISSKVS